MFHLLPAEKTQIPDPYEHHEAAVSNRNTVQTKIQHDLNLTFSLFLNETENKNLAKPIELSLVLS